MRELGGDLQQWRGKLWELTGATGASTSANGEQISGPEVVDHNTIQCGAQHVDLQRPVPHDLLDLWLRWPARLGRGFPQPMLSRATRDDAGMG